jgi:hypothetical protein
MTVTLKKLTICCCFLSIIFFNKLSAQNIKPDLEAKNSYFKGSLSYLSNSVFNGRKDSLITPYITPILGYFDKSGFYVDGSFSYLGSATEKRIDLFTLEAGYDFNINNQLSAGIYANKYFYNKSSTNIKSDIKGILGGSLSYDFGPIQCNAAADVLFASKTDFALNAGLSRDISLGEEGNQWTITPTVTTYLSTLNFYEGYTNRRAGKNAQAATGATITSNTIVTNRSTGLTLLDYELSLPVGYDGKKWGISLTPTFALPTNPIYTSTTTTVTPRSGSSVSQTRNTTPLSEKDLSSIFYAELIAYIKF